MMLPSWSWMMRVVDGDYPKEILNLLLWQVTHWCEFAGKYRQSAICSIVPGPSMNYRLKMQTDMLKFDLLLHTTSGYSIITPIGECLYWQESIREPLKAIRIWFLLRMARQWFGLVPLTTCGKLGNPSGKVDHGRILTWNRVKLRILTWLDSMINAVWNFRTLSAKRLHLK